ncbi:geranylgeranylglycerol-phosphate geranylgeranyltransferase [Flavobacterium succinicans]|uniref:Prenyltransferase n=1 Tax=Flavobacterium succinicans TaxID=29536 RepID=A0A199XUX4_9FLAO|nr:geranylgeranylglycerol-phosphate geranylgeranyltransferase [Flavobacterium succinicans]OAZ05573.1 prenyltransferase [Flavobacterium succinicans]
MKYLQLLRYQNLLLLALMQLILRFGFLKEQDCSLALSNFQYVLLVLATICIAAGGYVINDIFDQDTDAINKPEQVLIGKTIQESVAYNLYIGLTVTGVCLGFYLSNVIDKPNFAGLFILIAATLYFYATTLKQLLLIGNIIVALLLAISVLIIGLFDLLPVTYAENQRQMIPIFSLLIDYAVFAFLLHFIREITKDVEDIEGDQHQGMNTLAIRLGLSKTTKLLAVLSLIPIGLLLNYMYRYFVLNDLQLITIYSLIFIIAPFLYFTIKIAAATTKSELHHLSTVLKWIVFFGLFLLPLLTYNIHHHA